MLHPSLARAGREITWVSPCGALGSIYLRLGSGGVTLSLLTPSGVRLAVSNGYDWAFSIDRDAILLHGSRKYKAAGELM